MEEQVIINVEIDTGKTLDRLKSVNDEIDDLKKNNRELKDAIKQTGDADGELTKKLAENEKSISLLKGEQKSLVGVIQNHVTANASLGNSYNEINARVVQLQKEYKALTEEQRNSAEGKAILKSLNDQKQALKDIDANMGDHFRNVGNYPQVMQGAFGAVDGILAKFGTSIKGLSTGGFGALKGALGGAMNGIKMFSKTLLTTPLGWLLLAITAIVKVFDKLKDAIKKNDDASTQFQKLFASFKPIVTFINGLFEKLAKTLGFVAEGIANIIAKFSDQAQAEQKVVAITDRLEERERQYVVAKAKIQKQISELLVKTKDKEKYTAEERLKLLDQAQEKEKQLLKADLALKEYHNAQLKKQHQDASDTSDDAKNAEAQAEAELIQMQTAYNEKVRTLTAQRQKFIAEEKASEKEKNDAIKKANEERIKLLEESQKEEERKNAERLKLQDEISKALATAVIANMEEGKEKIKAQYDYELQQLEETYRAKGELTEKAESELTLLLEEKRKERDAKLLKIDLDAEKVNADRLQALRDEIDANKKETELQKNEEEIEGLKERLAKLGVAEIEERELINERLKQLEKERTDLQIQAMEEKVNAFGSVLSSIGQLADAFGDKNKAAAAASKALALGQVAVETGVALAKGIAKAQDTGPFPANIVAIATTTATILANIATATKTIKGAKFAEGGIVGGNSFVGDKLQVNVNSGEMILNNKQQKQLFDIANGNRVSNGINYDALATAMSALPSPVMDYAEFTDFKNRTARYNELTTL